MSRAKYFSDDYFEARQRFLAAASAVDAKTKTYIHPSEKGPSDEELAIDTAWLGPSDPDVILLCISGTHGPEGFCGSAAQLQSLQSGALSALPKGVSVLFVHALNPFGFAYMTRYNENNVDLNRNWIDFHKRPADPELYQEIHASLPPANNFDDAHFMKTLIAFSKMFDQHGGYAIENGLSMGQYSCPDGIGFGGERLEWSVTIMRQILDGLPVSCRHVAYLDWHSLIRRKIDEMVHLCFNEQGDPLFERCKSWWGAENVDLERVNEQWSEAMSRDGGRPARRGILMWGVLQHLAGQRDVAGGVVEFTDDNKDPMAQKISGLRAMLISRYLANTRDVHSPSGRALYKESRELWAPTNEAWQEQSLQNAERVFGRTLKGAGAWAREDVSPVVGEMTSFAAL